MYWARAVGAGLGIVLPFMTASGDERSYVFGSVASIGQTKPTLHCKSQFAEAHIATGWFTHTLTVKGADGQVRYVNDTGEHNARILKIEADAQCGAKSSNLEFVRVSTNWWAQSQFTCKGVGGSAETEPTLTAGRIAVKLTLPNGEIKTIDTFGYQRAKDTARDHCSGWNAAKLRLRS